MDFLRGLVANNDREWFARRRADYEHLVLRPLRSLAAEFGDWFAYEVDAGLETRPVVGRVIGRVWRDTRFSRDKSLFRPSFWMVYRNRLAPIPSLGFYWELTADEHHWGLGFYSAAPMVLRHVREAALSDPKRFYETIRPIEERPEFTLSGDRVRRSTLPGAPEKIAHWLDRRSLYVETSRNHDETLTTRLLVDLLWDGWDLLVPLYLFLRDAAQGSGGLLHKHPRLTTNRFEDLGPDHCF